MAFRYYIIHYDVRLDQPRGIFAYNAEPDRIDLVGWNHLTQEWESKPDLLRYIVKDESARAEEVTRDRAEEAAIQLRMQPLPTEAEMRRIGEEAGRRKREPG
jgi:hypothetical protein